jgi:hypothetical protein
MPDKGAYIKAGYIEGQYIMSHGYLKYFCRQSVSRRSKGGAAKVRLDQKYRGNSRNQHPKNNFLELASLDLWLGKEEQHTEHLKLRKARIKKGKDKKKGRENRNTTEGFVV